MEKIYIFADSACDIPRELAQKYQIGILPVQITHAGRTFREYYDITPQEYWNLLRNTNEIPVTAQITPVQFLESYRQMHEAGYTHALGVIMNGKGSGCYQSACVARDMFYEECGRDMRIEVVDSETYTMIYGRILLDAAKMREGGDSFDAILGVVRSRLQRSEAVLGVYSLKFLKKSGRISGGAAFVGEALGLKPVSHVYAGSVTVCGKARGEKNLVPAMVDFVRKRVVNPETQTAGLLYGDVPENRIEELEKRLLEMGFAAVKRWPIGVSVLTNTGPQALAVMYYGAPRDSE
ncbi:MAG: DegV family protein [Butyricicoccus sp.]|nr:DegV family protein [Butyricicoccus sp.]